MAGMDAEQAARDLAEVDQCLRRGAELVTPRWSQAFGWLSAVLLSTGLDIPQSRWRGAPMIILCVAIAVGLVLMHTTARARPLSIPTGGRTRLMIAIVVIISFAAMTGGGLMLQSLALPLPFTISVLTVAVVLKLLMRRGGQWGIDYVQQIRQGRW